MIRILRSAWRTAGFIVVAASWVLRFGPRGYGRSLHRQMDWSIGCSRALLRVFGVDCRYEGIPPQSGIVVSNHLGYLDIVVFAAGSRTVFVSKSEVGRWPGIGTLARLSGTLFINRARKADLARAGEEIRQVVEAGIPVLFFPEGTSSGGAEVLPFHAGLFAPAAAQGWTVTPAWIGYELDDGSVSEEVCYWKDMTFAPHFLNLMSKRRVRATVRYGTPLPPSADRKRLAELAHAAVVELRSPKPGA
jgi:1-acyl-sn-glycerol-3-phosphate acyltransferase